MRVKFLKKDASNGDYWDSQWDINQMSNALERAKSSKTNKIIKLFTDKKYPILEGGSGLGQWVKLRDDEGYDIYGVDFAKKTIKSINEKFPNLKIKTGNVFSLEFPDEFFGTYYSWGVAEHFIEGPDLLIKEANRVLKTGGRLLISVPFLSPYRKKLLKNLEVVGKGDFYQYAFDEKEFSNALKSQGFKIEKVYKLNCIIGIKKNFNIEKRINNSNKKIKKDNAIIKILKSSNIVRKVFRWILTKLSDNQLLTNYFGHMILFVAKK